MTDHDPKVIIEGMLRANEIDFNNRLTPCLETPMVNLDSRPLQIDRYTNRPDQELFVVRDDFLCGGTKSRVSYDFLKHHAQYREYVYISPWYGGAQIALPWLLRLLDREQPLPTGPRKATIIIDQYTLGWVDPQWRLPPFGLLGECYGANFIEIPIGEDKFRFAEEYAQDEGALLIKAGFDYPEVVSKIADYAKTIKDTYGEFDEAWVATGSGTMIRGLQQGGIAKNYYAVCIFNHCPDIGEATGIIHNQGHNDAIPLEEAPPYQSTLRYDSKVWPYVKDRPGKILIWNVM